MYNKYHIAIFYYILIFSSLLSAQDTISIREEFQRAVDLFKSQKYKEASKLFLELHEDPDNNLNNTASAVLYAKAQLNLNNHQSAKYHIESFLKKYTKSRYKDDALLVLSKIYLQTGDSYNALQKLLEIISYSKDEFYIDQARSNGIEIAVKYFSIQELETLYEITSEVKTKSFILLNLGKAKLQAGLVEEAKDEFLTLLQNYPDSYEKHEAEQLYSADLGNSITGDNETLVGVLVPLTKENSSIPNSSVKEILEGIKFAVSEYNSASENKVGLLIRDTKNNRDKIKSIISEFSKLSVKAVIGPIYSDEVRWLIEDIGDFEFPIISPTATDNDLTTQPSNFFQANPSFYVRAKAMAQYIYYVENKRRIAVLNAIEGYSPLEAHTFMDEFQKLGGEIINQTYKSDDIDLNYPVSKISSELNSIEGIFIPIAEKKDVAEILSALIKYNIDIPIYGNQDWFQAKGLETASDLSNKLILASDYFIDFSKEDFAGFNQEFSSRTLLDVSRNCLYGYDAAKYLLTVFDDIESDKSVLKLKMVSGMTFDGYHNNISFDNKRVNKYINVVRYKNGIFELIDKFKADLL